MPKKTDEAAVQVADVVPAEVRKAALLAELAEIDAAEKQAAKIEFPKALYKNGHVHDVVVVESRAEQDALGAEYRETPKLVEG